MKRQIQLETVLGGKLASRVKTAFEGTVIGEESEEQILNRIREMLETGFAKSLRGCVDGLAYIVRKAVGGYQTQKQRGTLHSLWDRVRKLKDELRAQRPEYMPANFLASVVAAKGELADAEWKLSSYKAKVGAEPTPGQKSHLTKLRKRVQELR